MKHTYTDKDGVELIVEHKKDVTTITVGHNLTYTTVSLPAAHKAELSKFLGETYHGKGPTKVAENKVSQPQTVHGTTKAGQLYQGNKGVSTPSK